MSGNSSILNSSDPFRYEIIQYIARVNSIILYVQIFIFLMGALGNLLAIIVINQKPLKNTSSAVFITYLALFDTAVLFVHALNLALPRGHLFLHCSLIYLTDLSVFCANWILVIITLERCIAVYSPFLAKRFCTVDSARYSIYIFLSVSIILFSALFPVLYEISDIHRTPKCFVRSSFRLFIRIYQPILLYAIPDLFLLSNLFTVYALCRRQKQFYSGYKCQNGGSTIEIRVSDTNANRKQQQLTIMLVTVSFGFYLFTTPAMISFFNEFQARKEINVKKMKQDFLFGQISVILLQLNNATNFIFYCFSGQRFRRVTVQVFHHYSRRIKFFYHRYILCNKQYHLSPIHLEASGYRRNTVVSNRSSCSPAYHRRQNQTTSIL